MQTPSCLYTIGYATHTHETFLHSLNQYHISALVDVRSSPYSRFKPEFNTGKLRSFLAKHKIKYVFLGDYCGAKFDDISCYVNGKVDFGLVAENRKFNIGLDRIRTGMKTFTIALMCAEKDPLSCHRSILIARNLVDENLEIKHILSNGKSENLKESESRLMKLFGLHHQGLFFNEEQRLNEAYRLQGEKIAYKSTIL